MEKGQIHQLCLAIKDLNDRSTGVNLKKLILEILYGYVVQVEQLYTLTTDNGKDLVKAVSLIDEGANSEENEEDKIEEKEIGSFEESDSEELDHSEFNDEPENSCKKAEDTQHH